MPTPTCPRCGECKVTFRGWRRRKGTDGHIAYCNTCEKYFTINPARTYRSAGVNRDKILDAFLDGKTVREIAGDFGLSKTIAHRMILEGVKSTRTWEEFVPIVLGQYSERLNDWYKNLAIDTTNLKVQDIKMCYLHAVDNYLK
jgi:transcription elongation factor Elf1